MKYGREVIDLLGAYPGRFFKMRQIINHIDPNAKGKARLRVRVGVSRVLQELESSGLIRVKAAEVRGASGEYKWKDKGSEYGGTAN